MVTFLYCSVQYQNEVLEVIDPHLYAGQTVMTKIQMKKVFQKGRKSATYMSFLGQVSKVSEWKVLLLFFTFSYATQVKIMFNCRLTRLMI